MSSSKIAGTKPCLVTLEAGRAYSWCACGLSKTQPFCDGSHVGTGLKPLRFTAAANEEALLCACKRTKRPPYCDGSHNALSETYEAADEAEIAASSAIQVTPRAGAGVSKSILDGGCYVASVDRAAMTRLGGLQYAQAIGPGDGARFLSLFVLEIENGAAEPLTFGESEAVLFVESGTAGVEIGGRLFTAPSHSGVYVRPREAIRLSNANGTNLRMLATVCPQGAPQSSTGGANFDANYPDRVFPLDPSKREPMADRFYQVLIGEETGSKEVTEFVGEIPRSRAAAHHHLYEEAIVILSGEGYMWTERARAAVAPGDIIFLPRKQLHSLECVSEGGMRLMGAFYPAGSPAINY